MLDDATPVPQAFKTGVARWEWESLLFRILKDGILYESPTQPVVSRDGTRARWMLETWPISLEAEGALLAGRCLLRLLEEFEGTQLATFGMTGIPLLQSCILQSGGRYTGLVIRKEAKGHGSKKLIEGRINTREPVILVDDSVSSGLSSWQAVERLTEAGLSVEGGVCLVRFGWKGGFSIMQGRGLHMEAVFDVWDHLMRNMADERLPSPNPSRIRPQVASSSRRAPEGLSPSALAREVMRAFLVEGVALIAPRRMTPDLETRGGVWVSLRSRKNLHVRFARDGFWRMPEEAHPGSGQDASFRFSSSSADVTFAALCTAARLAKGEQGLRDLEESGVAVTGFGPLEASTPGQLDDDVYGIVVRSRERTGKMGGALPRMPGIENRWRQLQHARIKNAGLLPHEPYEILRHTVHKSVEEGMAWQPTGVPRAPLPTPTERIELTGPVASSALARCLHLLGRGPAPAPLPARVTAALEPGLDSLYVTLYRGGRLAGCVGCTVQRLDDALSRLTRAVLHDVRFAPASDDEDPRLAVSVSFLTEPLVLGHFTAPEVMERVRLGEQALLVTQAGGPSERPNAGLLLPFVAAHHDLGRVAFAEDVLKKAGITGGRVSWTRFECRTVLAHTDDDGAPLPASSARALVGAFPQKRPRREPPEETAARIARSTARYLLSHQRADGDVYFTYRPLQNRLLHKVDVARHAHGTWLLARAARSPLLSDERSVLLEAAAARRRWLEARQFQDAQGQDAAAPRRWWIGTTGSTVTLAELAFALLCDLELGDLELGGLELGDLEPGAAGSVEPLAATLWAAIDEHGRFRTHRDPAEARDAFQDYTPGQALLALGRAIAANATFVDDERAERAAAAWRSMRHRCRYKRDFGQTTFMPQAALAWDEVAGGDDNAACAFDLADWLLGHQAQAGRDAGAFFNDHQHDTPGFTSALYLEGLAAAGVLAMRRHERARARRYADACRRALPFLSGLVLDEDEAPVLPNPALAHGGVRPSHLATGIRIDMSGHMLAACLGVLDLLEHWR